jgi:hypothetical protein
MDQVIEEGVPVRVFNGIDQGRLGRKGKVGDQHIKAFDLIEQRLPGLGATRPLRADLHPRTLRLEARLDGRTHVAIRVSKEDRFAGEALAHGCAPKQKIDPR